MNPLQAFHDMGANGNISLGIGSIVDLTEVNVLVNPVAHGSKYLMCSGEVSKVFHEYGQEDLQKEYETAGVPKKFGTDVTITGPAGAICCKKIFHPAIGKYYNEESIKLLSSMILTCLKKAEQAGMTSIAFPTVGCGKLGYDPEDVARCFIDAAKTTTLQIYIVAFTEEHFLTFRDFSNRLKSVTELVSVDSKPKPDSGGDEKTKSTNRPSVPIKRHIKPTTDTVNTSQNLPDSSEITKAISCLKSVSSNDVKIGAVPMRSNPHKALSPIPTVEDQTGNSRTATIVPPTPRPRPRPRPALPVQPIVPQLSIESDKVIEMPIVHNAFADLNAEVMRQIQTLRWDRVRVEFDPGQSTVTLFGSREDLQKAKQRILKVITEDELQLKNLSYVKRTRGVKEYLRALSQKTDNFPHYWNSTAHSGLPEAGSMRYRLVIGSPAYDAVAAIVLNTWDAGLATHGRDAVGLGHKNIAIASIWKIENPSLYNKYQFKLKAFASEAASKRLPPVLTSLGENEVWTKRISGADYLNDGLVDELNEAYLLHGTDHVDGIVRSGIDSRFCGEGVLFGKGAYFAESSTKSDQYADSKQGRSPTGQRLYMFVARVLLGATFLCRRPRKDLKRSPCSEPGCNRDDCTESSHPMSDSVIGTHNFASTRLLFREFIVYHPDQCYPEFLVEYERI